MTTKQFNKFRAEMLTQIVAGLLASGHYTALDREGEPGVITGDIEITEGRDSSAVSDGMNIVNDILEQAEIEDDGIDQGEG